MKHMILLKKLSVLMVVLVFAASSGFSQSNNNFEVSKNLDIYATLIKELNTNYVDDINVGELTKTGIDAMLKSLDPYTVYISEAEVEDYKFITTGQYGGIGALIQKQGKKMVIAEPYEGNPAQSSGLKAGDEILEVDGKSVSGMNTDDVSTLLKGQPGTSVTILIKRPGTDEPISKELERKNVKIDNIPFYGMVSDHVGYIKLSGFTQHAGKEVKDAFLELRDNNDLSGIIIDLRGNGGGLLQEAVSITNIFVPKGEVVVSTKGKLSSKNYTYKTSDQAVDTDIPLAILVDNSSASASEIVAGAIQDHDRGVIVGHQTFGKGLVQNVIPLTYNSQAKITVAKYYIPSGRCIQEIDYSKKDANGHSIKAPDSIADAYKTKNGRVVYDRHGIEPDIVMDGDTLSKISYTLLMKHLFFNFATQFALENESIPPPDQFEVTDDIYSEFVDYITEEGYEYTTKSEEALEMLKNYAKDEHYFENISEDFETLEAKIQKNKKDDVSQHKDEIKKILKIEIVSRYYYQKGKIIASLNEDPVIDRAIDVIGSKDTYVAILDGSNEGKSKTN
ncbi:MAG: S41 family peptidase [Bacteroidales bacterium]|nr:S41 family peptidase [Bacteroidales bacterium]